MSNKNMAKETFRDVEKTGRIVELYQEFIQNFIKQYFQQFFEIKTASEGEFSRFASSFFRNRKSDK